jgi:CRP-like cAMP-binding protein
MNVEASSGAREDTFLSLLDEREREAVLALGTAREFPRGAALMFQHERDDRVIVLRAGRVKVTRVDNEGRELLLSIRDPGDVLGELALVDRQPRVATVTALEPVEAIVAAAPAFRRHLETTPRIATVLLEIVTQRFRDSTLRRSQFAALDTMGRLAARLLELGERYGERSGDAVAVQSPLSQEELAAWTGASRAGVAQALHSMRELAWVRNEGRQLLLLDQDALRARAQ